MGKGQRSRQQREQNPTTKLTRKQLDEIKRKRHRITKLVILCIALIVVSFFGVKIYNAVLLDSGKELRATTAISTKHYKINNAMMSYLFYSNYLYQTSYNSSGIDTSISLKKQNYSEDQTFFDYFMDNTVSSISQLLVYAEAAKDAGIKLDKTDLAKVDDFIEVISTTASDNNLSLSEFITKTYGHGVKEKDIRDVLEIQYLAQKQAKSDNDKLSYTDEEINTYYNENTNDFKFVDYKSYKFTATVAPNADEATKQAAYGEQLALANELAASTNEAEFDNWLKNYFIDQANAANTSTTETTTTENAAISEEELNNKLAATLTEGSAYTTDTEFGKWAFAAERTAGEIKLIDEGSGTYTVYYLIQPIYQNDYATKNVRIIPIHTEHYNNDDETLAAAQKILDKWNSGDKTEESFIALANEQEEVTNGGLYENLQKSDLEESLKTWCYSDTRVAGDVEMIKSSNGYNIMYFVGDGKISWMATAEDALKSKATQKQLEDYQALYKVTPNKKNLAKIPGDTAVIENK